MARGGQFSRKKMKNHKCARKYKQWMFVLALFSRILVSEVVCSENSVKSKIQVTRVSQVTTSDKDNPKPISYLNDSVDDDHHTYELIGSGFNSDTDFFLLPTPSQDTCIVSSQTLPAIKINKGSSNDSLLYVSFKTNHFLHANQFYLCCFFDELLNDGHHLGNSSLFVM